MKEIKGIFVLFICFLLLLPLAFAGMGSDGTTYNVTQYIGVAGDSGATSPYTVRITGITEHPFDIGLGGIYKTRLGFLGTALDGTPPTITSQIIKLNHMKNGTENFTIRYNVSDPGGGFNADACWAINNGTKYSGTLEAGNTCEINISASQKKRVWIYPKVNDSSNNVGTGIIFGVNVSFDLFQRDKSKLNNLSIQNYLELINFSSSGAWENISWSKNTSEPYTTLNVTLADFQDNSTTHHNDWIKEDTYYTITGTVFNTQTPYQLVRYFDFNQSLSYDLPSINLSLEAKEYDGSKLIEKQNGVLWPDQVSGQSGSDIWFNLSSLAAGVGDNYRYSYNAHLINVSGDVWADFTPVGLEGGSYKKWQLRQNLTVNYNLTGKTVNHTTSVDKLGEWIGKTASWSTTLINESSNEAVTHTATDRTTNLTMDFDPPEDKYEFVLLYYTYIGSLGPSGGGGPSVIIVQQPLNATNGTIKFGTNLISCLVPYTGFRCYKETTIQAESGVVTGRIELGQALLNYGFTAEVCDVGTDRCGNSFTLLKGEKKLLKFDGTITEQAAADLIDKPSLLATVSATQQQATNTLDVEIDRAPLFKQTKQIADSRGWEHKPVAIITYLLVLVIVGWIGFEILRNTLS